MLKLLGRINSINVRKVAWLLDEIGTPYQREDFGRGFRPTSDPEFVAYSTRGLVPVLIDGDFVLTESHAILRYLASKHRRDDLYPPEPQARARVEEWLDFMASELNPAFRYAFQALSRRLPGLDDAAQIAASVQNWTRQMGHVEARLSETGGHIAGRGFSLADIPMGLAVNRWLRMPMELPALPQVDAYFARLRLRAACQPYTGDGTD